MSSNVGVGPGWRFNPSDEVIIRGFLLPKSIGFPLPRTQILEKNVYGDNAAPWEVFKEEEGCWTAEGSGTTKKTTFVFTNLTKSSASKRYSRKAGKGTWEGETGPRAIRHSEKGYIIGYVRTLKFRPGNCPEAEGMGEWNMHEYSLSCVYGGRRRNNNDVVFCKITKTIKEAPRCRYMKRPVQQEEATTSTTTACKKFKSAIEEVESTNNINMDDSHIVQWMISDDCPTPPEFRLS